MNLENKYEMLVNNDLILRPKLTFYENTNEYNNITSIETAFVDDTPIEVPPKTSAKTWELSFKNNSSKNERNNSYALVTTGYELKIHLRQISIVFLFNRDLTKSVCIMEKLGVLGQSYLTMM